VIQQIPLDGGLVTQVDPEEVGISACTELINAEFDKPGLIYKRKGRATATSVATNINEITRWVSPDGETYWIVCDTDGKVYVTDDEEVLAGKDIFTSTGTRVRISNYGSMLRFAGGLGYEPTLYQFIDRDFFWWDGTYGYEFTPAFHTDKAIPQSIGSELIQCGGLNTDFTTSMAHSTKSYQYKLTFVYDGNQETELPKLSAVSSKMAVNDKVVDNDDVFFFDLEFDQTTWNPRCTGINVYRREGSGAYYKVASASTLSRDKDQNVQVADGNAFTTKVMVDSSNGLTSAVDGEELYVNGFAHTIASQQNSQFASMTDALNGDLSNTWGTLAGHTNLIFDNNGATLYGNTTGGWFVGDGISNGSTGILDYTGATEGAWTDDGSAMLVTQASQGKYGSTALQFAINVGSIVKKCYYNLGFTGLTSTDVIIVAFWFKCFKLGASSAYCKIGISDTAGGLDVEVVDLVGDATGTDAQNPGIDEGYGWKYVQKEITLSDISGYSNGDNLYLTVQVYDNTNPEDAGVYIDNLAVAKKVYNTTTGKLGFGSDVVASTSLDLGAEDSAQGWGVQVGGTNAGIGSIKNNYQYSFKHQASTFSASTTETVHVNRSYMWKYTGTTHIFEYRDLDDTNGIVHPTGEVSLDVNFTYSINLDGRQYVAGVALNPSSENELHDDWVMFSELSQPDIIPITNYIAIPDMQGGEIKGLAKLIGDLVVFQSKGIYRLSIPSADPFSWSLSESEANIGCVAPDSIVEHDAGIFFAGNDNYYHLGANFQAIPVTQTIRDVYQGISNLEDTRAIIDVKKNRLLCKFGNSNATVYALDLTKIKQGIEHWSKMDMSTSKNADLFAIDEDLKVYTIEAGLTSYLAELNPTTSSESTTFKRTTGWISQSDLGVRSHLRKLNIRYVSTDVLTVKFYIDGDSTTVVHTVTIPADTSGADWYRCKPGVRGRSFMIEVSTEASPDDVEIRRMEVEIE